VGGSDHPGKGITMLYITRGWANSEPLSGIEWHVGAPLPEITGRVITFQADGDELECILKALRDTRETKVEVPPNRDWEYARYMKILEDQTEALRRNIDVLQRRLESVEMLFGDDVIRRANALVLERRDDE